MEFLIQFLMNFANDYPAVATVLMIMGILRAVMKPLLALLRAYVVSTPNPADDVVLDHIEQSPIMKGALFVLDWVASIKIAPAQQNGQGALGIQRRQVK